MRTKISSWEKGVKFTVATINVFDVVLGSDFMKKALTIPFTTTSFLMFFWEQPYVVLATILPTSRKKIISTIQFKKGIKRRESLYMAMPIYKDEDSINPVLVKVNLRI